MPTTIWIRDHNGNMLGSVEIDVDHDRIWWQPRVETTPNGVMVTLDIEPIEEV